jgi:RNA-directed DNA polymerase
LIGARKRDFKKKISTSINLLKLLSITKSSDRKERKYALFVDLKSAFDNVVHNIAFEKISDKLPIKITNSIKFLYSRFFVSICPKTEDIPLNKGVLQGGVLSPLLFNLYIDDLIGELKVIGCPLAYADDIVVIVRKKRMISQTINMIEKWSQRNKIPLNKNKSGIMKLLKSGRE